MADLEIRRLLAKVNGSPIRVTSMQFARLWDPPLHHTSAVLRMRDLVLTPPAGFVIEELEGRKVVIEIKRNNDVRC